MNKPASTLSIRLQLPPDEEDQPKTKPDETIYLWDRIIIAALAATIVVAGIVAGAWYALSGPIQEPMSPAMAASQSSDTVRSAAAEVKAPAASAAPLPTAAEPKPIENPPPAKKLAPLNAAVGPEPTGVSPSPKAAADSAKSATATTEPSSLAGQAAPIPVVNEAGENEGSCKVFAFAQIWGLTQAQTLACFGRYYREHVLPNPDGHDHPNIRRFIRDGWEGINFDANALTPR